MKLRLLAATLAALSLTAGVALAQPAPAKPAAAPAQQQYTAPDKATLSYALGYERGAMIARSGADIDAAAVARGLQDAMAKKQPTASSEKMGNALGWQTFIPAFEYCTDNAAMIAITGYYKFLQNDFVEMDVVPSAGSGF